MIATAVIVIIIVVLFTLIGLGVQYLADDDTSPAIRLAIIVAILFAIVYFLGREAEQNMYDEQLFYKDNRHLVPVPFLRNPM